MVEKDGLNAGEKALDSAGASFLAAVTNEIGIAQEQFKQGELVFTQDNIVFLEFTGFLKNNRRRLHSFQYSSITGIRLEKRGITGALTGEVFLVFDIKTAAGVKTEKYSCYRGDAERIKDKMDHHLISRSANQELRNELVKLVKPKGEANIPEIANLPSVLDIVSKLKKMPVSHLSREKVVELVMDAIHSLIAEGHLEGIVDEHGKYTSNLLLSRKTVQYQVTIDFTSLYSQLKNKGIVLEFVDCPSCKGKLDYPQVGSVFNCKYCGTSVSAMDVFEKFKGLLDI